MISPTNKQVRNPRMTQAERTALSDQRMFDATIALINERGSEKTTLKNIGQLAGYSRGMASYRFGSKQGLMLELFARFDDRWKAHLSSYIEDRIGISAVLAAADAREQF